MRLWGINPTNSVVIPKSLILRSFYCFRLNFNISKLVYQLILSPRSPHPTPTPTHSPLSPPITSIMTLNSQLPNRNKVCPVYPMISSQWLRHRGQLNKFGYSKFGYTLALNLNTALECYFLSTTTRQSTKSYHYSNLPDLYAVEAQQKSMIRYK